MYADEIHVIEAGRIVESGTHESLIRKNGRYAESWTRQTTSGDLTLLRGV
jgi:ABC-type transport system involved in Fe-S cluster assembly fused permease/ATPase subunit